METIIIAVGVMPAEEEHDLRKLSRDARQDLVKSLRESADVKFTAYQRCTRQAGASDDVCSILYGEYQDAAARAQAVARIDHEIMNPWAYPKL